VRIRPNDVVRIHVFSEPDLSATVRVQQDGRLSSPLVQDLPVEGLTPGELAEAIETVLGQFLTRPAVTVVLESVESYTIYVTGNVRNPGAYTFTTPVNVLQSLALAGGLSEFARRNGITIVRSRAGQEDRIFEFDYDLVVRGAASGQNIRLQTQDVVVVP
jgi:polysaccharide export outer membrane protein